MNDESAAVEPTEGHRARNSRLALRVRPGFGRERLVPRALLLAPEDEAFQRSSRFRMLPSPPNISAGP